MGSLFVVIFGKSRVNRINVERIEFGIGIYDVSSNIIRSNSVAIFK